MKLIKKKLLEPQQKPSYLTRYLCVKIDTKTDEVIVDVFNSKLQQNIPVSLKQSTLNDLKKVIDEIGPMFEPLTLKEKVILRTKIKKLRNLP